MMNAFKNNKSVKRVRIIRKRIKIVVRNRFNFETKQEQINKLTQAIIDNLIFIAKINFEKSLLF